MPTLRFLMRERGKLVPINCRSVNMSHGQMHFTSLILLQTLQEACGNAKFNRTEPRSTLSKYSSRAVEMFYER